MAPRIFMASLLAAGLLGGSSFAAEVAPLASTVLEPDIVCVRASRVPGDFAKAVIEAQSTNHYSGLVLDLRFADGGTTVPTNNIPTRRNVPLVILVNSQTRGPAAELAVKLRSAGRAVIIGSTNVAGNLAPDITVAVTAEEEKKYLENPFAGPTARTSATHNDLLPFIDHTSEAELVRRRVKDGDDTAADAPRDEPEQPVIRDPALARAVDLLKALTALHPSRG